MLRYLFSNGLWTLILIPLRLLALVVHEVSHGWVSTKLGDPTPRIRGRLTLNPMAHLDLWGTVLMLLTGFGWARPVEINPMYYKDRKKGTAIVAFAGPLSNLILAFLSLLLNAVLIIVFVCLSKVIYIPESLYSIVGNICSYSAQINLCFMVFNLIPIPPLDGSRILGMFLSDKTYYTLLEFERYSMIIIMVLSLSGAFSTIIGTGVGFVYSGIAGLMNKLLRFALGFIG